METLLPNSPAVKLLRPGDMVFTTPAAVEAFGPLTRLEPITTSVGGVFLTKSGRLFYSRTLQSVVDTSLAAGVELEIREATELRRREFILYHSIFNRRMKIAGINWEEQTRQMSDDEINQIFNLLESFTERQIPRFTPQTVVMGWYYALGDTIPAWWPSGTRCLYLTLEDENMAVDSYGKMTKMSQFLVEKALTYKQIELVHEPDPSRECQ